MKVKNFTTVNFVNLSPKSTIRDAISAFLQHRVDIACITNENKLIGIVHKYSIYRALLKNTPLDNSIEPLIKTKVITIQKDQTLIEARDIMIEGNVAHAVVLNENNEVYGIMSKSDLVQSHMAALQYTINRITSLIENLQDAVISVDVNLNIITYNKIALNLLQLNEKQLQNAPIDYFFPQFKNWLIDTLKRGEIQELKKININDVSVIASFIPIIEINNITGAIIVLRDMTSYEKIAHELETTKRLKKTIDSALELAYDGIVITDKHGKITKVNQGFMELFNIEDERIVIGKPLLAIAPEIPVEKCLTYEQKTKGELIEINGTFCIIAQMPIIDNGEKIGGIFKIIFRQLDKWRDILYQLEKLESEITFYREELFRMNKGTEPFAEIISVNDKMKQLKYDATIAAKSLSNILLTGESGTGKELFAAGIHNLSGRKGAFIKVNCGAIPAELLESEFFGYADGAFTGAKKGGKPGKFELAHNGTLFLDEIGDMPFALQVKLLRVLQEQEFERIGAIKTTKVNVRIIAATNKDLLELVKQGKFREDLYYRIHVIHLHIPPLRERLDDIPLLCKYFINKISIKTKKDIIGVSPNVIDIFQQYSWPGNVRQLENVLERAFHFSQSQWIDVEHLPEEFNPVHFNKKPSSQPPFTELDRKGSLQQTEKQIILEALMKSGGNRTKAAKILGISRTTLYQKLKKYELKEEKQIKFLR